MVKRFLILFFISVSIVFRSFSQNTDIDGKLRTLLQQYGQAEVTIQYTDMKAVDFLSRNISILSVKDKIIYLSLSPVTIEWFLQQKYIYTITEKKRDRGIITALNLNQAMEWDKYPAYTQYDSIMRSFKTLYPDLCRLDTIGKSINGKLILALKISDNAASDEEEPEVFYSSSIHGDETGGFVLMLRLADYLLKNYQTNARVRDLADNLEIWINPLANPDGMYRTGNIISSPVRYNSNGIDLNRNFPDPFTPFTKQEIETVDMMNFLEMHRFVISANFHSGAEVVNYPWDRWLSRIHADDSWFNSISRGYADTVHVYSGPAYMNDLENGVTRGALWYVIYGGRQDYVTYGLQGREVTVELDDQTVTPAVQLPLLWQYNWRSLLGYLENALYGIHGVVLNKITSEPVPAKIFISGHDKDSSQVYSDSLSGKFVRYLAPGTWNLTFSAYGFRDTTISNVAVFDRQKTDLVVNMAPVISGIDTAKPVPPVLYPNPSSVVLNAILPDQMAGTVSIRIYSGSGKLLRDYLVQAEQGIPLHIDIQGLAGGVYTVVFTNKISKAVSRARFVVIK
jgi:murein tripeptide amidase MpaA